MMTDFEKEVAKKWLSGLIPEIVERGGDEKLILGITETLVVGTLHVLRESFGVDPQAAFERMKTAVDQRLADMVGDAGRTQQ